MALTGSKRLVSMDVPNYQKDRRRSTSVSRWGRRLANERMASKSESVATPP